MLVAETVGTFGRGAMLTDGERDRIRQEETYRFEIRESLEKNEAATDEDRQEYLDERKLLIQTEIEAGNNAERYLVTLSSGALALTITFIRYIAPQPTYLALLFVAWGGFILSLLAVLLSLLTAQFALRRQREILDDYYYPMNDQGEGSAGSVNNSWARATNWLNIFSIVFIVFGVGFFAWFAIANLP